MSATAAYYVVFTRFNIALDFFSVSADGSKI